MNIILLQYCEEDIKATIFYWKRKKDTLACSKE